MTTHYCPNEPPDWTHAPNESDSTMACPTCSHTMEGFGSLGNFWCPRCGTIVRVGGETRGVPKLVERCRQMAADYDETNFSELWHSLGIRESINIPPERPTRAEQESEVQRKREKCIGENLPANFMEKFQ